MSQSSPFGHPVPDDPTGQVPVAPVVDGPPEKKTRVGLLAVAGAGVVVGAALLGFLLMSGTSDDDLGYTGPIAQAPKASTTASPSPSATPLPTESTVNARNPFLAPPSPSASGEAGGSTSAPGGQSAANPGTQPTTAPATTTPSSEPVLVTLVGIDADTSHAKFKVNSSTEEGKRTWSVARGKPFGNPLSTTAGKPPFKYWGWTTRALDGAKCANVQFVDAPPVAVCKGETVPMQ